MLNIIFINTITMATATTTTTINKIIIINKSIYIC